MKTLFISIFIFFKSQLLMAMPVTSETLNFEVPDNWICNHTRIHIKCFPKNKSNKKVKSQIVAVVTSYPAKASDDLAALKSLLDKPKSLPSSEGTPSQSKVYYTKELKINNAIWLNSLHFGSEVPNYYTQYIATINSSFMHVINISAHRSAYKQHVNDISKILYSLKLNYTPVPRNTDDNNITIASDNESLNSNQGFTNLPDSIKIILGVALALGALAALLWKFIKK